MKVISPRTVFIKEKNTLIYEGGIGLF
jgi:hypothetical protein